MLTSDASWSGKLRIIGDLERPDHWHLQDDDDCAFFGEYTPRAGFRHSATNQLILNMKKKPSVTRGTYQWPHKVNAIKDAARAIRSNISADALLSSLFIPIPSSKRSSHPDYDPRMLEVAKSIGPPAREAEVLRTIVDRDALHENDNRRDPDELAATISVHPELVPEDVKNLILIDDMVTTGCSFRACKRLLSEAIPGRDIFGLFISRRILPNPFAATCD